MGLQISAAGILTAIRRNDITANNIANSRTAGYQARRAESVPTAGGGVRLGSVSIDSSPGSLSATGQPLDLSVNNAFFRVRTADGTVGYTRSGAFGLDASGNIATADGARIDPPVTVPPNATSVTVGRDGSVYATLPGAFEPQLVGSIEVYTFSNPDGLSAAGGNILTATPASGQPVAVSEEKSFLSGILQQSNVNLATEFTNATLDTIAARANANAFRTQSEVIGELLDIQD